MIYLDNNATTILDPEVYLAMRPLMERLCGNPSSTHRLGQESKSLLVDALRTCARTFGVSNDEIVFTSGASEALNFVIRGLPRLKRIVTSSLEHPALFEPLKSLNAQVCYLDPLPGKGALSVEQLQEVVQMDSVIVLGAVNSETGIKTEIEAIAQLAEQTNSAFIVDGVALLGKERFVLPRGVTAACFSAHKIHGPLGVGLAVVRKPYKAPPLILGGPQQGGKRAGTENLPAIVGFAKALQLLDERWIVQMEALRERFEEGILSQIGDVIIHGKKQKRVCNTSNCAFLGVDGETLVMALDMKGVAASYGSACSSGALSTSRVLLAMGIEPHVARSSVRFSLSRFTTKEEIDRSIEVIANCVKGLR